MHVFQPYPLNTIEVNPFTISGKIGMCITADSNGEIDSFTSMSCTFGKFWEKDVITTIVRENRSVREVMDNSEFFSLTFFKDESCLNSLKYLKAAYKHDPKKIEESGLHINRHIDIPFIDEGHLVFLCSKICSIPVSKESMTNAYFHPRVFEKYYKDGDFHHIFVGEILEILAR